MQTNTPLLSSNQTHNLYHTFYDPKDYNYRDTIKATLIIAHGMAEHSGRYHQFAQFLASQGIAVTTYDQLGHGKTIKTDDELGFIDSKYPVQIILRDVVIVADALKYRHPNVPHFIMGHSMGSFIVRNLLKHHGHSFDGAILMGTADQDPLIKLLIPLFTALNKTAPHKHNSWAANTMSNTLNGKVKNTLGKDNAQSKLSWLSRNTHNIDNYESDSLCGFDFTNNGFFTLFNLMDAALNGNWYQELTNNYPLLIISGQDDPIGNMGKGIKKLNKRLCSKGFNNITTILYPNMRHEPLHEEDNQQVYQDIATWIRDTAARKLTANI